MASSQLTAGAVVAHLLQDTIYAPEWLAAKTKLPAVAQDQVRAARPETLIDSTMRGL